MVLMPSPVVMAAAYWTGAHQDRENHAILGNAFGVRDNPLNLAERHAMIDVLHASCGLSPAWCAGSVPNITRWAPTRLFSHERFHEAS